MTWHWSCYNWSRQSCTNETMNERGKGISLWVWLNSIEHFNNSNKLKYWQGLFSHVTFFRSSFCFKVQSPNLNDSILNLIEKARLNSIVPNRYENAPFLCPITYKPLPIQRIAIVLILCWFSLMEFRRFHFLFFQKKSYFGG